MDAGLIVPLTAAALACLWIARRWWQEVRDTHRARQRIAQIREDVARRGGA